MQHWSPQPGNRTGAARTKYRDGYKAGWFGEADHRDLDNRHYAAGMRDARKDVAA